MMQRGSDPTRGVNFLLYATHMNCLRIDLDKIFSLKEHLEIMASQDEHLHGLEFEITSDTRCGAAVCYQITFNLKINDYMADSIVDVVELIMHETGKEGIIDFRHV